MALPAGITTVTVTRTYLDGEGAPLNANVAFAPSIVALNHPATDSTIVMEPVVVDADQHGQVTATLIATDDTDTTPTGWTWTVTEWVEGVRLASWPLSVPTTAAGTGLDLADVAPAVDPVTVVSYATSAALAAHAADPDLHSGTGVITGLTAANFASGSVDGVAGTASLRTLGTGAQQAAAGSHGHGLGTAATYNTADLPVSTATTAAIAAAVAAARPVISGGAFTAGDVVLPASATWAVAADRVTPSNRILFSVPAVAGDVLLTWVTGMTKSGTDGFDYLDLGVVTSDGSAVVRRSGGTEGRPAFYPSPGTFRGLPGPWRITVAAGDISGDGRVYLALLATGTGSGTVYASGGYPLEWSVLRLPA